MQLGKTHLKLMACYDFSGTFDLQSDLIEIVQYLPPQRLLVTNETTIYGDPVLELEAPRSWFRDYKTSTSTRRTGEICRFGSGAEHMPAGASQAPSSCLHDASLPLEVHRTRVGCTRRAAFSAPAGYSYWGVIEQQRWVREGWVRA